METECNYQVKAKPPPAYCKHLSKEEEEEEEEEGVENCKCSLSCNTVSLDRCFSLMEPWIGFY
jgi:hypothetical protein